MIKIVNNNSLVLFLGIPHSVSQGRSNYYGYLIPGIFSLYILVYHNTNIKYIGEKVEYLIQKNKGGETCMYYEIGRLTALIVLGGGIAALIIKGVVNLCRGIKRDKRKKEIDKVQLRKYAKTLENDNSKKKPQT